jgi:protein-tyrosine-phosphatase
VGYKRKARIVFLAQDAGCALMAQEFSRCIGSDWIEARAACLEAALPAPEVVEVMAEAGCPLTARAAELCTDSLLGWADLVVTMDAAADRKCASMPRGVQKRYYPLETTDMLAQGAEQRCNVYRALRDGIGARIAGMVGGMRLLQRAAAE